MRYRAPAGILACLLLLLTCGERAEAAPAAGAMTPVCVQTAPLPRIAAEAGAAQCAPAFPVSVPALPAAGTADILSPDCGQPCLFTCVQPGCVCSAGTCRRAVTFPPIGPPFRAR